jgi:hypothetical protein
MGNSRIAAHIVSAATAGASRADRSGLRFGVHPRALLDVRSAARSIWGKNKK